MTKDSPGNKKRLVSIKGACVAPSSANGDLVTLGGRPGNAAEEDMVSKLVNYVKGVKSVKNHMTIEESK